MYSIEAGGTNVSMPSRVLPPSRRQLASHLTSLRCQQGMEFYSTVLWHLKDAVALSFLAQEAIALDRHSPHAWAVLGNCFSLQKVRR